MPLFAGSILKENLVLESELAKGAMGVVWRARNHVLECDVAVKVLSASAADETGARARFAQEARIVARIDSPHVVAIHDYGITDEGEPFLVMELLRGRDLRTELSSRGTLEVAETTAVVRQMCSALGRAHDLGIVHRDVKPANVFLIETSSGVFAKLLDFGIAKLRRGQALDLTATTALLGTPYYMSPEQFVDPGNIDHRADLWSAAVVAYACLVGTLPFEGETVGALSLAVHRGTFPAPSKVSAELPEALDGWFRRALDPDPDKRFPSASELATSFQAAVSGELEPVRTLAAPRSVSAPDPPRNAALAASTRDAGRRDVRWEDEGGVASTLDRPPRFRGRRAALIAACVVGAVSIPWAYVTRSQGGDPAPQEPASRRASSTAQLAEAASLPPKNEETPLPTATVRIAIRPSDAQVTVDGIPRDVRDGAIELEGRPGDRFLVAATSGSKSVEQSISIQANGRASVDSIGVKPADESPPSTRPLPRRSAPPETKERPVAPASTANAGQSQAPTRDAWE